MKKPPIWLRRWAWPMVRWRLVRFIRRAMKRNGLTEVQGMDFLKGLKTQIGAFGALLAQIAALLADFAGHFERFSSLASAGIGDTLDLLRNLALTLMSYGAVQKLIRIVKTKLGE